MESDWERRADPVCLEVSDAAPLLERAARGAAPLSLRLLSGGFCNTNYAARLSDGRRVVLRLYQQDPGACRKEADVLGRVAAQVRTPALLDAEPTPASGPPYLVLEWVPGERLADLLRRDPGRGPRLAEQVGRSLAAIHSHRFAAAGFFGPGLTVPEPLGEIREAVAGFAKTLLGQRAGDRLAETRGRLEAWLARNLDVLDPLQETCLVHADFKPTNILASAGELTAVLDWEFAFAFTPLFDVGQMLRYEEELPPGYQDAFIRSYLEHGGELPAGWERAIKVIDLVNLLCFLDSEDERPAVHSTARRLIERTLTL